MCEQSQPAPSNQTASAAALTNTWQLLQGTPAGHRITQAPWPLPRCCGRQQLGGACCGRAVQQQQHTWWVGLGEQLIVCCWNSHMRVCWHHIIAAGSHFRSCARACFATTTHHLPWCLTTPILPTLRRRPLPAPAQPDSSSCQDRHPALRGLSGDTPAGGRQLAGAANWRALQLSSSATCQQLLCPRAA